MPAPRPTRQQQLEQDARDLARLGYAQQLFREMGGFSNFAISFSIISVLTGAVLLYGYGLKLAGPVINTLGWPVVSVFTLCVAASMAELASAYPTAGGLYFWAFRLGGRGWAWLTAWLNMIGHVTIASPLEASSADLGGGRTAPALVVADYKIPSPLFALAPGLLALYGAVPVALVFVLGLLQAQWTYTGYDASAHVAEETVMARLNSAWGVFLSVAISAVVGYALLLVLTWSIPKGDVAATANDAYPVLQIAYGNLPPALGHVIAVIIGVAMWLCGLASITSMGRMWYAFARDDGMPGARFLKRVHPALRTPVWSIVATSTLAVVITIYAAAYSVVTSISTITLYLAYVIPIWLNWLNRLRRRGEYATRVTAPRSLGRFGPAINAVAILWVIVISVVFALPPNELVLWTMLLLGGLIALYWWLSARHRFVGPAGARR